MTADTNLAILAQRFEVFERRERESLTQMARIEQMLEDAKELREHMQKKGLKDQAKIDAEIDSLKGSMRWVLGLLVAVVLGIAGSTGAGTWYTHSK